MANEISGSFQFRCLNGNFDTGQIQKTIAITQNTVGASQGVVTCATTGVALPTGSLVTYGMLYMQNLDASITVTYGSSNTYEFTLQAGEVAWQRVTNAASISLKSASGSPKVQYIWLND